MDGLAREMPAEVLVGVVTPGSAQTSNTGGGPRVPAATNTHAPGATSTQTSETENINLNNSSANAQNNSNNTISAAADSSDNQPSTPQPNLANNNETTQHQHTYATHHIYNNSGNAQQSTVANSNSNPMLNHMYAQNIYTQPNMELQQQQQLPQHLNSAQNSSYPSFLNSYEQFYQQQQQNPPEATQSQNPQQMDFINSNTNSIFPGTTLSADYKQQQQQAGIRYHPYTHTATSGVPSINAQNSNSNNSMDTNSQTAPVVSAASSSVMSPRVVSSTSPSSSSNQMQISGSASSIGSMSVGNPSSPHSAGTPQCKKCGIMCTNDSELQEHITNGHGASPYGSSGYASSPYIKEEMQQQTPPSQNQQQPSAAGQGVNQTAAHAVNPGEILDLDSQKLLYSSAGGSMPAIMHTNLTNATDPLHSLHSMQQRAGVNTWDPQSQEGLPPYLAQPVPNSESKNLPNHSDFYQSPKLSPYHITNTTNIIKTEYQPVIKSEYTGDTQYMDDKSFDPTTPNQQQQMLPPAISSSPSEFPSTTTGGPQDNQQYRAGNFEPPSSSSASVSTGGPLGTKAANWKSNEARRPKTYNCTACSKWFTSSGHLKRHYNTTLHKNAVKSSGQPDPATLPISVHHHPARDPNGKAGRSRGSNAAANNNSQQQQQPPNPVQPPEPPNSPQAYGSSQVAAAGLTHYTAIPSPNNIFEHHQYQYVPQVQSMTNVSPQHATSMSNQHLIQNQQQQQQTTVLNGHPNGLAGLSVPTTIYQQQTPMSSSQMRGLLNKTMPLSTAPNTIHITKIEHLEAAPMDDQVQIVHEKVADEFGYLSKVEVKQEFFEEMEEKDQYQVGQIMYSPKLEELELEKEIMQQQLESVQFLREVDHNVEHHHSVISQSQIQYQLDPSQQQEDMDQLYHNTTSNSTHNMPVRLPLIISQQIYQEQQQEQHPHHQTVDQDTYTLIQTPQSNTTAQQYISMPLATNMQPNNMLQLQQQLITMEQQQLPQDTIIPTTNMVSILPLSHRHTQQQPLSHMELQPQANMSLQQRTANTSIPSHTTTSNIISIPSFQHPHHPGSELLPDHMQTSPPTIIGNTEVVTVQNSGNLLSSSGQQVIQTATGQLLRLLPSAPPATAITSSETSPCYIKHLTAAQKSPPAGDLPPILVHCPQDTIIASTSLSTTTIPPSNNSDTDSSENIECRESLTEAFLNKQCDDLQAANEQQHQHEPTDILNISSIVNSAKTTTASNKRSRNSSSSSSSVGPNSTILPSGRIKCLPCDKEFTKICYLTQHNNSFHSGEYPYRCQKCGKRYQTEQVYIVHLNKHKTIDKAHKCELCPKQFHHKTDLRRHIEAIHTGNKQHSCDICEKSFCRKDHLRKHLETHNRARVLAKKHQARSTNIAALTRNKKPKDSQKLNQIKAAPYSAISTANLNNLNKNKLFDCVTVENNFTALPILQQVEVGAGENDKLLKDKLNEFNQHDVKKTESLMSRQEYRVHSQYNYKNYLVLEVEDIKKGSIEEY